MNLRSGKALIKRSREDIISKLPEALLIYILSLLPNPFDAIRTCVLSKTWKHLWVSLPNLYFILPCPFQSPEKVKAFHDSVDNALALRGGMLIRRFSLCYSSHNYGYGRLLDLFSILFQSKLEILELNFRTKIKLSWYFLEDCSTLVELTLNGICMLHRLRSEFRFPCLKKLNLISVEYSNDQTPQTLISRCPDLQELHLEKQLIWYLEEINISSPYLKRLRIRHCKLLREILIEAPRLEYLYIEDDIDTKYSLTNPLSLVEAHINRYDRTVVELLACISVAKRLTIADESLRAMRYYRIKNVPTMFPNLVKLDVDIKCHWGYWSLLFNLLNQMPSLEQFTISYGHLPEYHISQITLPSETPNCLRLTMKEIIIRNEGVVTRRQFFIIGYLLRHSTVLERLTLNAHNIDHETREQLLNFQCGSHMCRIEFV